MGGNGREEDGGYIKLGDVWSSSDGVNWTEATRDAPWSDGEGQLGHTSVVYANKIWLLGGYSGSDRRNDAWHTTDGINWVQATGSAPWALRYGHSSVVSQDKI